MASSAGHHLRILQLTDGQVAPGLAGHGEAEQLENYGLSSH
jgi:hypothetical protein